ncbi:MAG TPA: hypothetical protein VFQ36_13705 [Ktedonobacteraceae bacterium]|nr:hypothetical protein [Ktedonobacteraceae bacterium]
MNTRLIPNLLDVSLCLVALFIAVRSFDIYSRFRQYRLFILGLSMVLLSLSAAADFTSSYISVVALHTDWFLYIGQSVGFLFILLSLVQSSDRYLRSLMNVNILVFILLLILLLLSPALPAMPNATRTLFGFARLLICMFIMCAYFSAYMNKPVRFSLLMSASFFFFTIDYLITLEQYVVPTLSQYLFRAPADIIGVIGLVMLVSAVSIE